MCELNTELESSIIRSTSKSNISCSHCGQTFETRNSLFRHLRNDPTCSNIGGTDGHNIANEAVIQRDTIAILCSYDSFLSKEENYTTFLSHPSDAEIVGKQICDGFDYVLKKRFGDNCDDVKVVRSIQTSVANHRGKSLGQENGVSSTGDVMTLSYEYPTKKVYLTRKKAFKKLTE